VVRWRLRRQFARIVVLVLGGGNNFDQSAPEPEHVPAGSSPITDEDIPF